MIDRPDVQIDGLDRADRVLHPAEGFVGSDCGDVVERGGRQAGAHGVEAVERRFSSDLHGPAREGEGRIGDLEGEVLGHFVPADHGADRKADLRLARERRALAPHRRRDAREIALGRGQQILALAGALGGESVIAADDQALAREVG